MIHLLVLGATALLALVLTPGVRALARRLNLVDAPGDRKIHTVSVPRVGGVGVAFAMGLALAALAATGHASVADFRAWLKHVEAHQNERQLEKGPAVAANR